MKTMYGLFLWVLSLSLPVFATDLKEILPNLKETARISHRRIFSAPCLWEHPAILCCLQKQCCPHLHQLFQLFRHKQYLLQY